MPQFIDIENGFSLRFPYQTTDFQEVSVKIEQSANFHRVHLTSPDHSQIYFELHSFSFHREESIFIDKAHSFLSSKSSEGKITNPQKGKFFQHTGTFFDFEGLFMGKYKIRRFLFIVTKLRTYQIVYDYTSKLNEDVLKSLVLQ